MTVWFIILLVIVLAFLLINIVLYFIQEKFIFDSEKLPKNYKFTFDKDFEEIFLKTDDGQKLNAIHSVLLVFTLARNSA